MNQTLFNDDQLSIDVANLQIWQQQVVLAVSVTTSHTKNKKNRRRRLANGAVISDTGY